MPERLEIEREEDRLLKQQHLARYRFASEFVRGRSVLDVACGTGYGSALLAGSGARTVTGLDASAEAIGFARARYARAGLEYRTGDAQEDLSSYADIDAVVSFETIEHLPDPQRFLKGVCGCLRPEGVFLVSTPVRRSGALEDKPGNPFHVREWNPVEFEELLGQFFSRVELRYQYSFRKLWYPGSRTIGQAAARVFYPARVRRFLEFDVALSPVPLPGIPVEPEYMIAICGRRPGGAL